MLPIFPQYYLVYLFFSAAYVVLKIPDSIDEILILLQKLRPAIKTHCHCELMHEVWCLLMDDAFLQAYCHGIVIVCIDGVKQCVYPRIFMYSANYPEK